MDKFNHGSINYEGNGEAHSSCKCDSPILIRPLKKCLVSFEERVPSVKLGAIIALQMG